MLRLLVISIVAQCLLITGGAPERFPLKPHIDFSDSIEAPENREAKIEVEEVSVGKAYLVSFADGMTFSMKTLSSDLVVTVKADIDRFLDESGLLFSYEFTRNPASTRYVGIINISVPDGKEDCFAAYQQVEKYPIGRYFERFVSKNGVKSGGSLSYNNRAIVCEGGQWDTELYLIPSKLLPGITRVSVQGVRHQGDFIPIGEDLPAEALAEYLGMMPDGPWNNCLLGSTVGPVYSKDEFLGSPGDLLTQDVNSSFEEGWIASTEVRDHILSKIEALEFKEKGELTTCDRDEATRLISYLDKKVETGEILSEVHALIAVKLQWLLDQSEVETAVAD